MKTKLSFLFLFVAFFYSCNSSSNCNCETDCTNQNLLILTPENSISSEALYASYLTFERKSINEKLSQSDGQITEDTKARLENAIQRANLELAALGPKVGGGICPPCPERLCCNGKSYLILSPNFDKVNIPDLSNYSSLNSEGKTIVPIDKIDGSLILTFEMLDLNGEKVNVDFQLK